MPVKMIYNPAIFIKNSEIYKKILAEEKELQTKQYTDQEIISFMGKQTTGYSKEYYEDRAYLWYEDPECSVFLKGITTFPSLSVIEREIIKTHLEKNKENLNIDLYFDFFNKIDFKNCEEYVSYFCSELSIARKLTDEQVVSIYKVFPGLCREKQEYIEFEEIFQKLRRIVLENKFSDVINRNDEIIRLLENEEKTFISLDDINISFIKYEDLKYIIKKLNLEYAAFPSGEKLQCFLQMFRYKTKYLYDDNIRKMMFNKLKKLDNHELEILMFEPDSYFNFSDILNKNHLNYLCRRHYNCISESEDSKEVINSRKFRFLKYFSEKWISPTANEQKKALVDIIVEQMINARFDEADVRNNLNLIHCLITYATFISQTNNFSKQSLTKLLNQMKTDNKFLYTLLDSSYINCPYEFEFIKSNIINEIGTLKVLKLLDDSIDLKSETLSIDAQKAFEITKNIVVSVKKDRENQSCEKCNNKEELTIRNVFNKLFEIQYNQKDARNSNILRYLDIDVYKYLNEENKDMLLMYIKSSKWDKLLDLIIGKTISYDQFVKLWNYDEENLDSHFSLINELFERKNLNVDLKILYYISNFVAKNRLKYIRYIAKNQTRSWTDLEIIVMCDTESFENIASYLKESHRFTPEQWDEVFKHFYKTSDNPFVPFGFALNHYLAFDEEYKILQNGKTYKDSELVNVNKKGVNRLIKKVKNQAKKDQEAFDNEPLPF